MFTLYSDIFLYLTLEPKNSHISHLCISILKLGSNCEIEPKDSNVEEYSPSKYEDQMKPIFSFARNFKPLKQKGRKAFKGAVEKKRKNENNGIANIDCRRKKYPIFKFIIFLT